MYEVSGSIRKAFVLEVTLGGCPKMIPPVLPVANRSGNARVTPQLNKLAVLPTPVPDSWRALAKLTQPLNLTGKLPKALT